MKTDITFEELAKQGKEVLNNQLPVTYEQAIAQVRNINKKHKKKEKVIYKMKQIYSEAQCKEYADTIECMYARGLANLNGDEIMLLESILREVNIWKSRAIERNT